MSNAFLKGAIQGLLAAGIAFITVNLIGYNTTSLSIILYLFLVFGAMFEFKNSMNLDPTELLGEVVVVAEEEEKTLKRVFKDKKYKVKGELEEIQ